MALGDILSVTVRSDGWSADVVVEGFTTGATYAFGLGTNNADLANAKVVMTVVSLGYDSTGTATTISRTVYGTWAVRKPYPLEASKDETAGGGNMTWRMALSMPVYAKDKSGGGNSGTDPVVNFLSGVVVNTGGGSQSSNAVTGLTVTNNSTLAYPKVHGRWAWPGFERWTGATLVEMVAFHPFGRNGNPVACVKFDCDDTSGNSAAQQTASAMTATTRSGDAQRLGVYAATIPVTALTQGNVLTTRFRAYPWVGDSASVCDSATSADGVAAPSEDLTPLMALLDKNDTLACYASVDGVGGSPAVAATAASARTTPYATLAAAFTALKTYNNTNNSDNSLNNCIILMQNGSYTGPGTFTGSNTRSWCIVQADLANGATEAGVIFNTATNQVFNGYIQMKDVTVSGSGAGAFRGNTTTGQLWLNSCTLAQTSTSAWYAWRCEFATQNTVTAASTIGFGPFAANKGPFALVRGNNASGVTNGMQATAYCVIGNTRVRPEAQETGNASGNNISDNVIIGWNQGFSLNTARWLQDGWRGTSITKGISMFGNVAERITDNVSPFVQITADATLATAQSPPSVVNVYLAHNTFVGQRENLNYLEGGATTNTRVNWFDLYNLFRDFNCKSDVFSNAVRTVTDGITVSGSTTVTSATAAFVAGDVGQNISLDGIPNGITTISSRTTTTAVMAVAATVSASNVTLWIRNFGKSGVRVGNWAFLFGCGVRGSRYELSGFPRDFAGINVAVVGSGNMGYIDNESVSGGGAGNGNYQLDGTSPARNLVPAGEALLPFDITGTAFGNAGDGSAGALQRSADLPTYNPGLQSGFFLFF